MRTAFLTTIALVGSLICLIVAMGCQASITAQDIPLAEMTDEQIRDLSSLRDPNSVEEVKQRVLKLAPGYGVRDAKVAEVRRTTLGELKDVVHIQLDDPGAPVWYIILSGTVFARGPPVETPRGYGQGIFPGLQVVWQAKKGGWPLGHQPYGRLQVRLQDGSVIPYTTRVPELVAPTATPTGGPPMPVRPAGGDSRLATATPTRTPTSSPQ
jgi:hypothetical protein